MTDSSSVFRSADTSANTTPTTESSTDKGASQAGTTVSGSSILKYEQATGRPYAADHYGIGDLWGRGAEKAFKTEIGAIDGFVRDKVLSGNMADSTEAVKKYLRSLEKGAKCDTFESDSNKIAKIYAYIKFLQVVES